jgi:hypothetical protein
MRAENLVFFKKTVGTPKTGVLMKATRGIFEKSEARILENTPDITQNREGFITFAHGNEVQELP